MQQDEERALAHLAVADGVAVQLDLAVGAELGCGGGCAVGLGERLGAFLDSGLRRHGGLVYLIWTPEIAREITRRWISEVPSKIVQIFASRTMRSTGNSRE